MSVQPEGSADPRVQRSRRKILQTAAQLLLSGGPAALTIDAVVAGSGVSRMTVYRHWENRHALLLDTFRSLVPDPGPPDVSGLADPLDRLVATVVEYGRQFDDPERGGLLSSLVAAARRDPELGEIHAAVAGSRGEHLARLLQDCVDAGKLAQDLDLDRAISQLMGPLAFRHLLSFEPIDDDLCRALVADLVAAHPGPHRG